MSSVSVAAYHFWTGVPDPSVCRYCGRAAHFGTCDKCDTAHSRLRMRTWPGAWRRPRMIGKYINSAGLMVTFHRKRVWYHYTDGDEWLALQRQIAEAVPTAESPEVIESPSEGAASWRDPVTGDITASPELEESSPSGTK